MKVRAAGWSELINHHHETLIHASSYAIVRGSGWFCFNSVDEPENKKNLPRIDASIVGEIPIKINPQLSIFGW
jgi:hypothetical protein